MPRQILFVTPWTACILGGACLSLPYVDDSKRYLGLHTVGMLRELIRKWWHVDIGFADAAGRLLDEAWGHVPPSGSDFCRALLASDPGRRRCLKCVREIGQRFRHERDHLQPLSHICHLGLGMTASPLLTRDRFSGFIFSCGYSSRELSRTRVARLRGAVADLLPAEIDLAGERVPWLGREDVERMKELLAYGASEMTQFDQELTRRRLTATGRVGKQAFAEVIAHSPAMSRTVNELKQVAAKSTPILLMGKKGTGKQVLARAVHVSSPRRKSTFTPFLGHEDPHSNEARLFGQIRGGPLGRLGVLEATRAGTAYLGPQAWQSPEIQVKLLRLLQEQNLVPLGGQRPIDTDVRLILGIESDLERESGVSVRPDLAQWLRPYAVEVPRLHQRIEDIGDLIQLFIRRHSGAERGPASVHPETLALLQRYAWPGNAVELEEEIRSLLSLCPRDQALLPDLLSLRIRQATGHGSQALTKALKETRELKHAVEILEKELIREGLIRTHANKSLLARQLGISRSNLLAKIEKYRLSPKGTKF